MAGRVIVLACVAACGFPRPADVLDNVPTDADPAMTIHVAPNGDDANDGFVLPVKTVKHALGLATVNLAIGRVELAPGRYSTAQGETFPYTVPPNLTVAGPAGGGAILVGSGTEVALTVESATLQDLEFESFALVLAVTGKTHLTRLRVRLSSVAVRGDMAANIVAQDLDLSGVKGACGTAIELNSSTSLLLERLTTQFYAISTKVSDQAELSMSKANIAGDSTCTLGAGTAAFSVASSGPFTLTDSIIDGGNIGVYVSGRPGVHTRISGTTIRNVVRVAANVTGDLDVNGGLLSSNPIALNAGGGVVALHDVAFVRGGIQLGDGMITLRSCSITSSASDGTTGSAAYVFGQHASYDFGTVASPGNNTFQLNSAAGVEIEFGVSHVDAVGNTWRPGVQGADAAGHYSSQLVGPVGPMGASSNFIVGANATLQL
jgi:hypothetical protein